MTIKEEIIEKIDQMPESALLEVLEFISSLKARHQPQSQQSDAWKAYLASKQERKEVYRRLAGS